MGLEHIFDQMMNGFMDRSPGLLYLFLFVSAILENLFPPVPGDTVTVFGAFLVSQGKLSYLMVYLSTTLGSVIGFFSLFLIARIFGKNLFNPERFKWLKKDSLEKAQNKIQKYGYWIITGNRFLPGIRSVISISAGLLQMNPLRVLLFSLVSASLWNLIWIHIGYTIGSNWDTLLERISGLAKGYNIAIGSIILMAIIIALSRILYIRYHKTHSK